MKTSLLAAILVGALSATHAHAAAPSPETAKPGAKIYGDPEHGKETVEKWCVACHKAGPSANDQVPAITDLATNPRRTDGAIRAFLAHPHRPMPPLELSNQQIEDIISYLHNLRAEMGQPR